MSINSTGGPREARQQYDNPFDQVISESIDCFIDKFFNESRTHDKENIRFDDKKFAQFQLKEEKYNFNTLLKVDKKKMLDPAKDVDKEIAKLTDMQRKTYNTILARSTAFADNFHMFDEGLKLVEGNPDLVQSKIFKKTLLEKFTSQPWFKVL